MSNLFKFARLYIDLISITLGALLWWFSGPVIDWLDPYAGTFSAGQVQRLVFAAVATFVANGVVLLLLRLRFPVVMDYFNKGNGADDFMEMTAPQRVALFISLYLCLFVCFAIFTSAL